MKIECDEDIEWLKKLKNDKGTEKAYPRQRTTDKDGEYRYLYTECGNWWYSVNANPMYRNNCICPNCGKTVKVVI